MNQESALRSRFAGMDTDALLATWATQERLEWAETLLAAELESRGVAASRLQALASGREAMAADKPVSARDTFVSYGLLGRAGTVMLALAASKLGGALFGETAGKVAMLLVFLTYALILAPRLLLQARQGNSGAVTLLLVYQFVELGFLLLFVALGFVWLVSGPLG